MISMVACTIGKSIVQRSKARVSSSKHISMIKLNMQDMAEKVSKKSQRIMEREAHEVMDLARKYAPHDDTHDQGHLDDKENWEVQKKREGLNRRNVFIVRLKEGKTVKVRNGKSIPLRRYSRIMHDKSDYNLSDSSKRKAKRLGLGTTQSGMGKYVGRLYLTRAAAHRRLRAEQALKKAAREELK